MKAASAVLIALVVFLAALGNAHALSYNYTTLVDFPGSSMTTIQYIDNAGTIVGGYAIGSTEYGFSLKGGVYTSLGGVSGEQYTEPNAVNSSGLIVGGYGNPGGIGGSGLDRGFSLSGGTYTTLNYPGTQENWVTGLNDKGVIVGWYIDTSDSDHSYYILNGSNYHLYNGYPGAGDTDVTAINNEGTIVGYYHAGGTFGFVGNGTTYTSSLNAPGASNATIPGVKTGTHAQGVNDAGTVVGYYADSSGTYHGFVLNGTTYSTVNVPGSTATRVYSINDEGAIVGTYTDASGVQHGFIATPATGSYSLSITNPSGQTMALNGQYVTFNGTITNNSPVTTTGGGVVINGGQIIFTNDVTNNANGMVTDSHGNQNGAFSINQATVVFNNFTNQAGATFTTNQSAVTFNGHVTNMGTWITDPSTIIFNGAFTNSGTVTTSADDTFEFLGTGIQVLNLGSTDISIGSLVIGAGTTLNITGSGLLTAGGSSLTAGYYDEVNGVISSSSVPLPAAFWLLGPGLAGLAVARRKFKK